MKYATLNNGIKMPLLGLGTFLVDDGAEAYDTVLAALKIGYRHIDTAQMYRNEESIGRAIVDSGVPRNEIFITTKLRYQEMSDDEIRLYVDDSLKKLQTDYVDLILIHWPCPENEVNVKTWKVFEEIYNRGKAKAIGLSNFQIHHLDRLLPNCKVMPAINQVELHPCLSQLPLKKYMSTFNIQIESYGPFMKGRVFADPYFPKLEEVAKKYNASVAQIIIAWGLNNNVVMIPKSVSKDRLQENFDAHKIVIKKEDMDAIDALNWGGRVYTDPDNNVFWRKR